MLAESNRKPHGGAWRTAAVALAILAAAGCRSEHGLVFPRAPVVLVSVDTLRADHLPAYGYRAVDTPNLDALRADSVLFMNAYSQVPLTLPSHTTIFTGLLPPQSGVRDNLGYALGPSPATIAGLLRSAGYATGAAVSSIVLSHATGVSRGFDFYDDNIEPTRLNQSISRVQRSGGETLRRLIEWLDGLGDRRFFAFLHLFEPHSPYEPPEPYRSRFKLPYDGEIATADAVVGELVRHLKTRALYEKSLIVFLSDHGEGLNDHGEDEHGVLLYREAIHVPLMIKFPGSRRAGGSVRSPVALVDVFPTLVRTLALPAPAGLPGVPLTEPLERAGAAAAERRIYSETLYPRLHLGWSDLASLIDARHHYIESPRSELYDVVSDPRETADLAPGLPPAFRSLRAALAGIARPLQPPGGTDPEQVRKLAALGYLSGTSADLAKKDLPSPRDRIGAVEKLKAGFGALQDRRYAEAAARFRELLSTEPGMTDVWQMLSDANLKLGRDEEAFRDLREAARLSPGNPQVLLALSEYYLSVGDFAQARRHAEAAGDAGSSSGHENLARIALAQGDLETAAREAEATLARYPYRRIPRLILGRIRRERRDYAGALDELELARRPRPGESSAALQNVNFWRGDCLARLGREAEAEAAFREEIRDFPGNPAPRTGLALLYASQGREAEARRALAELVGSMSTPDGLFAAIRTYEVLGDRTAAEGLKADVRRRFPQAKERRD